jgi:hypothetical protein
MPGRNIQVMEENCMQDKILMKEQTAANRKTSKSLGRTSQSKE